MLFLSIGLFVGTLGTLIGAGGGFILVPVLLFLFPEKSPQQITAISLFCVAVNSFSGSITYLIYKRVHLKSAILYSLATLPGAYLGVRMISQVERSHFDMFFALILATLGVYLTLPKNNNPTASTETFLMTQQKYTLGTFVSLFVGFIASFFGIGGGIIHVPLLAQTLNYPVYLAVGTSNFVLAITSTSVTVEHFLTGGLNLSEFFLFPLVVGLVIGAQIGAQLSKKMKGPTILRILGFALLVVATRIFINAYFLGTNP